LGIEEDKPIFQHARKRALSGQQIQAEKLMRSTKRKLSELSVGNNVIIPIPQNFKNWRSGLSELQVQRWLQNFKMQVQKKISCVFHVVMVLWHAQTSKFENWKLTELRVLLTWFCKILLMCFEQLQIGKKLYKL
jgi:hypothetical protein